LLFDGGMGGRGVVIENGGFVAEGGGAGSQTKGDARRAAVGGV
jgi:hypothetical protein